MERPSKARKVLLRSSVKRVIKFAIAGDSRIHGLDSFLEANPPTAPTGTRLESVCWMHRGATIRELGQRIERKRMAIESADCIIIIGGICSLTKKEGSLVYYPESKVDSVIGEINEIVDKFGEKIQISTIPPAKLIKASQKVLKDNNRGFTVKELEQQQRILLEDIDRINNHIINISIQRDSPTLLLAKSVLPTSKKWNRKRSKQRTVTKFRHNKLRDGVHPDHELKKIWFDIIANFMTKIATKISRPAEREVEQVDTESALDTTLSETEPEKEESTSESESDHGAFRRKSRK